MQSKSERKTDIWGLTMCAVVIATSYPYARYAIQMSSRSAMKFSLYNPFVMVLMFVSSAVIAETVADYVYPGVEYKKDE